MARRLSEKEKKEITSLFIEGKTIEELSYQFKYTKLTISRNIKKNIGEKRFKELFNTNKTSSKSSGNKSKEISFADKNLKTNYLEDGNLISENNLDYKSDFAGGFETKFTEIIPLDCDIENLPQKDLSSVPISEVDFPKIVYMIVDKNIELEIKFLKDFSEWNFLAKDELNRKTIQIYIDHKVAKRSCSKEQKVIKVPNTDVFKIVAPLLISRGISRIVSPDKLIAL